MTLKERTWGAILGKETDRVPFTTYPGLFPEREPLVKQGLIGTMNRCAVYRQSSSGEIQVKKEEYQENNEKRVRYTYKTPVGKVWETLRTGGGYGSSLRCEYLIKDEKDYEVVKYMVRNRQYEPNYDALIQTEKAVGNDGVVVGNVKYDPIQEMLVMLMGTERFSIDYYERRGLFNSLYEAIAEKDREIYQIAVDAPTPLVIYGGNVTSEIMGPERFDKYCVPRYNEFGEMLHAKGKLLGVHLDGNLQPLKKSIADSMINVVEAFNPAPDGDTSVKQAREAWPDKVISINFTSSIHLAQPEEIREHTIELLRQSYPGERFIIGITENVPDSVRTESMKIIAETLREKGNLPLNLKM
jgi:hypothetical protein